MPHSHSDALALSRRVLRILRVLNAVMGVLILALLIASLVAETAVMGALGARPDLGGGMRFMGMRLIMVLGIAAVPVVHFVLTQLLAIVDTVHRGNPFVTTNARRLTRMAWAVLGLECLHFVIGIVAAMASTEQVPLNIGWEFSITRWLAVLMLFVLARVFEQGAQMRDDLEGTV